MENYIMTLKRNEYGALDAYVRNYDGSLEMLRETTDSEIISIYDGPTYLELVCSPVSSLKDVLIVCDDNGKLKNRPTTLPILDHNLKVADVFVGDLSFIARKGYEGDDRGLTRKECEELIEGLQYFLNVFPGLHNIERVHWLI